VPSIYYYVENVTYVYDTNTSTWYISLPFNATYDVVDTKSEHSLIVRYIRDVNENRTGMWIKDRFKDVMKMIFDELGYDISIVDESLVLLHGWENIFLKVKEPLSKYLKENVVRRKLKLYGFVVEEVDK